MGAGHPVWVMRPPWRAERLAGVALAVSIVMFGVLAFSPLAYALVLRNRAQRALRHCPLCSASAVREAISQVDGLEADVRLQCGQCGAWRRVVVPREDLDRHARRVERDRHEMETHALRLQTDHEHTPH